MGITVPIKNKAHLSLKAFLITLSLPVLGAEILCETEILSFSLTVYEKEWLRYIHCKISHKNCLNNEAFSCIKMDSF